MRREILSEGTQQYARDSAAEIYKAEPPLVAALRELYEQFGVRAMSRALRQLKSERGYLRIKRQTVN